MENLRNKEIKFTIKDLFCEATLALLGPHGLVDYVNIFATGILYNQAQDSHDPVQIAKAYRNLNPHLQQFKHNFLGRGKSHW